LLAIVTGLTAVVIGYLLGSIPGAYIISKLCKGIDIRKVDTGNVGTASTLRAVGIWQGITVLFIDVGKGAIAIIVAQALGVSLPWVMAAGFAAFIGHNFPLYIGFKGGQGAATLIGLFLVLTFWATATSLVVIGTVMLISWRKVLYRIFFAILVGGPLLPIFIWIFYGLLKLPARYGWLELLIFSLFCIIFLIIRNWQSVKKPLQSTLDRSTANHR
jgi:glycerol-3-phosphate acyltransferase PlsY